MTAAAVDVLSNPASCCGRCGRWIGQQDFVPVGLCTLPANPCPELLRIFPRTYAGAYCTHFISKLTLPPVVNYLRAAA